VTLSSQNVAGLARHNNLQCSCQESTQLQAWADVIATGNHARVELQEQKQKYPGPDVL
jgi:galactitol-specific phosphotransferase system IIB component